MIDSEEIKSEDQVKLIVVLIDNKLSYNEYISTYLKQASTKSNSIKRLGNFISKYQRKILCYSYILSHFKYCPMVWYFGNISNIHKAKKLHESVIQFIHFNFETYHFTLMKNLNVRIYFAQTGWRISAPKCIR